MSGSREGLYPTVPSGRTNKQPSVMVWETNLLAFAFFRVLGGSPAGAMVVLSELTGMDA